MCKMHELSSPNHKHTYLWSLQNAKRDANVASGDMHLTREVPKHRSEYARPFLQLFINI